jgi:acetolactate synthase-1/2/3 large subunit
MRVADYIAQRIVDLGVEHVFLVTGGGAMHLDDAIGLRPELTYVCNHHEQACAIAVEGYARVRGDIGVAVVTSGPGGTNAITGVLGQWHDSVPALYVSGQVKYETTVASTDLPLRQLGDQEADIVRLVAPITKYAVVVNDPATVRYHFEKAVWLARAGRPGPVWLDVPLNVQAFQIDPATLPGFDPAELLEAQSPHAEASTRNNARAGGWSPVQPAAQSRGAFFGAYDEANVRRQASEALARLQAAERPVILAGSAVRSSGAVDAFLRVVDRLGVPVCTAWNAQDVLWEDHPLFAGRPGTLGDRAGNFALQNADVLLSVGCRLNVRQIGYEFPAFARAAFRIVVDIDEAELHKPTIRPDMAVAADVQVFLSELKRLLDESPDESSADAQRRHADWMSWCLERRRRYPVVGDGPATDHSPIDPYVFVRRLSASLEDDEIVVCANGTACVVTLQALQVKRGQRVIVNSGTAGMGYDLPAAIGACFAGDRRVVCLAGDGSIMMNLQELQTVAHHHLPVKVFVFDNQGYLSIRQTQDNLLNKRRVGEGPRTGVGLPDYVRLAQAVGWAAARVTVETQLDETIKEALASPGPYLLDVVMDPERSFEPRVIAQRLPDGQLVSKPLEDMHPFLPRDEFADNMVIQQYESGADRTRDAQRADCPSCAPHPHKEGDEK